MDTDIAGPIFFVGLAVIAIVMDFIPYFVAKGRNHPNATAIFMLCLFAGWTFVGWVVAIVWAYMGQPEARVTRVTRKFGRLNERQLAVLRDE